MRVEAGEALERTVRPIVGLTEVRAKTRLARWEDPDPFIGFLRAGCRLVEEIGRGFVVASLLPLPAEKQNAGDTTWYGVPEAFCPRTNRSLQFSVGCVEEGGSTNDRAVVVCSLTGAPFRQYRSECDHPKAGYRALFCIPMVVATISAIRSGAKTDGTDWIVIETHRLTPATFREGQHIVGLRVEKSWEGTISELPSELGQFWDAARAAQSKLRCSWCNGPHYTWSRRMSSSCTRGSRRSR